MTQVTWAQSSDGVPLWCHRHRGGPAHRLPVVLLSPQAMDDANWTPALGVLGAHRDVVVLHPRGVGRSGPEVPAQVTTREFARDVVAVLDALEIPLAHVYGQSMGGRVAQWLAVDHPDRVAALVLGSTTPGDRHGVPRPAEVTRVMTSGASPARAELFVSAGFRHRHPELTATLAPAARSAAALRAHFHASRQHDAWAVLPDVQAPTLVLHGTADQVCPVHNGELLAQRIPGATLRRVRNGRHGFHVEFAQTAHWVEDFCRRFDRSAP